LCNCIQFGKICEESVKPSKNRGLCGVEKHFNSGKNFDELCKPIKKVISELPDNLRWLIRRNFAGESL